MKLLLSKKNKSRFTMDYKLVEDNEKINEDQYTQYGLNAEQCLFSNVIFENGVFEYQGTIRNGVVCQLKQEKVKNVFQVSENKIINRYLFDSTLNIENGSIVVKAIFACDKSVKDIDKMRKKFETNLRVQVLNKIQKQIQQLLIIKSNIEF